MREEVCVIQVTCQRERAAIRVIRPWYRAGADFRRRKRQQDLATALPVDGRADLERLQRPLVVVGGFLEGEQRACTLRRWTA